jgi:peptidoglycan-associated lipoprotein
MNPKIALPAALVAIAAASSGTASAQEDATHRGYLEPPRHALELTLGTGYTQGFGLLHQGVGMPSVSQAGIGLDFGLGYRIDPHWMIGAMGEFQDMRPQRSQSVRGVVAGIQVACHFVPSSRFDPWMSLGTGYRFLYETQEATNQTTLTQGLEMGRVMVGLDWRVSRAVAMGPVIGADIDEFLTQDNVGGIQNPGVSTFVHAGILGRFDFGGMHDAPPVREEVGVTAIQPPLPPPVVALAPPPPQIVVVVAPPPPPPPPPEPVSIVAVSPSISVSTDILTACQMKLGDASRFAFDDSRLTDSDRNALDALATCFTTGPLKDEGMHLVGRADPRGKEQYNIDLGMRRAVSAATYLNQKGVESGRIEKTSRGALDASGTDEAGWAVDRRVDITLAK